MNYIEELKKQFPSPDVFNLALYTYIVNGNYKNDLAILKEGLTEMPRIDNMYNCCNYNQNENLNKTCRKGNEFKICILLDDNYYCYDFKNKEEKKDVSH